MVGKILDREKILIIWPGFSRLLVGAAHERVSDAKQSDFFGADFVWRRWTFYWCGDFSFASWRLGVVFFVSAGLWLRQWGE